MKKSRGRRAVWWLFAAVGVGALVAAFLVWGPHASAERREDALAKAELKEWMEARWAGEDTAWERLVAIDEELKARAAGSGEFFVWQDRVQAALRQCAWDDPEIELLHARMEGVAGLAERYVEAAGRPLGGPRWEEAALFEDGLALDLTMLLAANGRLRRAEDVLDYAMRVAGERGDWEEVERIARAWLALSRMPMQAPSVLSAMQARMSRWTLWRVVVRVSAEQCMPGDVCRRMAELVRTEGMDEEMIREMWRGERAFSEEYLREVHTRQGILMVWKHERLMDDPFGTEESEEARRAGPSVWERVWNVRAYFEPRMAETARVGEEIARACEEWMLGLPGSAGEDVREPRGMAENVLLRGYEAPFMGLFSTITASESIGRMWVRDERAAVISLLVSAYRADHGEWPRSLEEAMPVAETVDPVTGKPFEYRLLRNHIGVFELYAPEKSWGIGGRPMYGAAWRSPSVKD